MTLPPRPRLREHVDLLPEDQYRRRFRLRDALRLSDEELLLSPVEASWVRLFDGRATFADLASRCGNPEWLAQLVTHLDAHLLLDGPAYQRVLNSPVRRPACLGVYEPNPEALREQLRDLFGAGGVPRLVRPDPTLCAVLLPHMDYHRGQRVYAPGFRALVERNVARLFVIIAT